MSGGHFSYSQSHIRGIADEIEDMIGNNGSQDVDRWGYQKHCDWPPEVIEQFQIAVRKLHEAYVYAQRIDWLVSGDDGEDSFLRRLKEDLAKLEAARPEVSDVLRG